MKLKFILLYFFCINWDCLTPSMPIRFCLIMVDKNMISNPISLPNIVLKSIFKNKEKYFNGCHYNAQSLSKNIDEVRMATLGVSFDFICISETWLTSNLNNQVVNIDGFSLIRKDRDYAPFQYGGVGIYFRKNIKFKVLSLPNQISSKLKSNLEYLLCEVYLSGRKLLIGVIYNPPISKKRTYNKFKSSIKDLQILLSHYSVNYDDVIIAGDFNFDTFNPNCPFVVSYKSTLKSLNLKICNNNLPTHFSLSTCSLIDHLIIRESDSSFLSFQQLSLGGGSHHDMIVFTFDLSSPVVDKFFYYRDYENIDNDKLVEVFDCLPWHDVYYLSNPSDQVVSMNNNITLLFDEVVPWKFVKIKPKAPPWFNEKIRDAIKNRNDLYEIWKYSKRDRDWLNYKQQRNKTLQLTRCSKTKYLKTKLDPHLDAKLFWKNVRNLGIGKTIGREFVQFTADEFNNHFLTNFSNGYNGNVTSLTQNSNESMFGFSCIDENELFKAVMSVKSNAVGIDDINLKFIKLVFPLLSPFILYIFNHVLTTSIYPQPWKYSKIIPIPKIKSPALVSDYRPISLLPILSKVFEIILKQQIIEYLTDNNKFNKFQSAYRRFHSTSSALLNICDDIRHNMDSKKVTILALLDFSKAFDTINHYMLCQKLSTQFNFSSTAISLIFSYLSNRFQSVLSDDKLSDSLPVLSGVPQGSVLGPILFSLYISDVTECIKFCKYHLYADDLQIYNASQIMNVGLAVQFINGDLQRITDWAAQNYLKLNSAKSQAIIIYKSKITSKVDPLIIQGKIIPYSENVKNLGVIFNNTLTWTNHVDYVSGKIYRLLHLFWKVAYLTDSKFKTLMFKSFLLPHFLYADIVFYGMSSECRRRLTLCYNSCLRFVFNLRKYDHISEVSDKLLNCKFDDYLECRACFFILNLIRNKSPEYLYEKLRFSFNFKENLRLKVINSKCKSLHDSVFVSGVRVFNNIPLKIKHLKTITSFRGRYLEWKGGLIYA